MKINENLFLIDCGEGTQIQLRKFGCRFIKIDHIFISAPENVAWLLNIRGDDAKYTPLPFCHALISKKKNIICFCDLSKISTTLKKKFNKIQFLDINSTGEKLSNINSLKDKNEL